MLTRLAVWGDPVAHSRSPQLHSAAYRTLGLDWTYERRRVAESGFVDAIAGLDAGWRGLSLTMPLKQAAYERADELDRFAQLTRAVNTYRFTPSGVQGCNTDVGAIVRDLRDRGIDGVERARIVGAGSTATSALVALAELGAERVEVVARRAAAVDPLVRLGAELGLAVTAAPLSASAFAPVTVTVATLPGGVSLPEATSDALAQAGGALYDVVYGQWPSALAQAWQRAGHPAWNGLGMLLQQAVLQVRIFLTGYVTQPLPGEPGVVEAMRAALVTGPVMGD